MALLEIEGFDHRQVAPSRPGWTVGGNANGTGRFGGFGLAGSGSSAQYNLPAANTGTTIMGCAWLLGSGVFMEAKDGTTRHLGIQWNSSTLRFELLLGSTVIATSSSTYTAATWHYTELKATIANAGGTAILKVDGVTQINFTGDTQNGASAQVTNVVFNSAFGCVLDDVYIMDGTGSAPYNDFLGDVRVSTLTPNGNGAASQLVGSDGNSTDNYLLVDDVPPSASDYVGSATVGQRDIYAFSDLPTTSGQALAVRPLVFAHKSDAGAANIKVVSRMASTTERVETAQALSATLNTFHVGDLRTVDPENAAWTIASVNATQFGVEVA